MNIKEMKFSVLMSVYHKENPEYFLLAVESVIKQSVKPTEVVIVKDGVLTKDLENACEKLLDYYPKCIRFVSLEENVGLGLALQKGVLACKYDLIARMDTDDISKPERFEKQLKVFAENPNLAVCGGFIEEFSSTPQHIDSVRSVPLDKASIYRFAKKRNPFNHMTVMFRKQAVLDAGGYRSFYLLEDYYLWFRMIYCNYDMINIPHILVSVRAGKSMYERRGGFQYFLSEKKLYGIFLKKGYIGFFTYMFVLTVRFACRVLPKHIRSLIYTIYIRK